MAYFRISKLRNKPKHFLKFYQIFLLLSRDISLNVGPCEVQFIDGKTCEPLKIRDLHFCHLNVNSLLYKIDELRNITYYIRPAILGITDSKLDSSFTDAEVNINGYSKIRKDRNRNVEVLHDILETICVLISRTFFQIQLNMFFRNSHTKS